MTRGGNNNDSLSKYGIDGLGHTVFGLNMKINVRASLQLFPAIVHNSILSEGQLELPSMYNKRLILLQAYILREEHILFWPW